MMITRLQAKRRRIERDEKVRIQFNSAMDKVNEMVKSYKQDVDNNEYRFYTPNWQIPLYIRYSSYPLVAIFTFNFNLTGVRLCD